MSANGHTPLSHTQYHTLSVPITLPADDPAAGHTISGLIMSGHINTTHMHSHSLPRHHTHVLWCPSPVLSPPVHYFHPHPTQPNPSLIGVTISTQAVVLSWMMVASSFSNCLYVRSTLTCYHSQVLAISIGYDVFAGYG